MYIKGCMDNLPTINIFWFRRDLRLDDNAGLFNALNSGTKMLPIFIFDKRILSSLEDKSDRRVAFIHRSVSAIQDRLVALGSSLEIFHSTPLEAFGLLADRFSIGHVFANHDYEPYPFERDRQVKNFLASKGIGFHTFKDQVIFEKTEVAKEDGSPYSVFTPYSKKWKSLCNDKSLAQYPSEDLLHRFVPRDPSPVPSLESMGFRPMNHHFPAMETHSTLLLNYATDRDFPGKPATSRLGVHLRFGTISIRKLAKQAKANSEVFLNELIWREFYQAVLWNFPHVGRGESFKKEYDKISWRNNTEDFRKWCEGRTGYPLVDAGMRELNASGFMHNRVRMVTASFLSKHLLLDWRWGELYFAKKLLDFDMSANNGGWQWASGSGCDAAPYFRVFNPTLQTQKFDPNLDYVRTWVPELNGFSYPKPMVDHDLARKRALETYSKVLKPTSVLE